MGSKRTQLYYEAETLNTSLCFGLAEGTFGDFPRRDGGRRELVNPGADFHPNKS